MSGHCSLTPFVLDAPFLYPLETVRFSDVFRGGEMVHWKQMGYYIQKQPSKGALWKRYSESMQQFYRRTRCRSVISIKLLCNFIEITFRHGCSPVNLLHIFRTPFPRNTSGWLLLKVRLLVWITKCNKSRLQSAMGVLLQSVIKWIRNFDRDYKVWQGG